MRTAKITFLVALSFFLFAAGYRLLAVQPAQAQAGSMITGFAGAGVPTGPGDCAGGNYSVMTPNGDVYFRALNSLRRELLGRWPAAVNARFARAGQGALDQPRRAAARRGN